MKKFILFGILAALCPFLRVAAQSNDSVPGLRPGDRVPDLAVSHVIHYPSDSLRLSDFRGKLLVLDFWATWCSPCVAMVPVMDSLQKEFAGTVQFLPVAYQPASVVGPFIAKLEVLRHMRYS